jgi:plasmid maintenance system killer protein
MKFEADSIRINKNIKICFYKKNNSNLIWIIFFIIYTNLF